uniref:Uncharacterized protein n=1 Tax=viral metagenome TaxID=1070528 RepID=A0A2V0RN24_9ZZZZ
MTQRKLQGKRTTARVMRGIILQPTELYKTQCSFSHFSVSITNAKTLKVAEQHPHAMISVHQLVQKHLNQSMCDDKAPARENFIWGVKEGVAKVRVS